MSTDQFQAGFLERLRKQRATLGGVVLTLFLAGLLNMLVQPCLMAAPISDCHESMLHHQVNFSSSGSASLPEQGGAELFILADCNSMQGCIVLDHSYPVLSSLDLEKNFLATVVIPVHIQPGPVSSSLPLIRQNPVFSQAPLFIQNCAFLI